MSSARNAGECDLTRSRATRGGDRACRGREMEARVRFRPDRRNPLRRSRVGREMQARVHLDPVRRNPLRRSCVSRARNAGESAFRPGPAQPSLQIVRVEGAKCRQECVLDLARATLCGDRARPGREMQARVRFGPVRRNPLRRSRVSTL